MVSQKPKYCKNFERNSHWRKLSIIMVWERYCNASPKPEFFLFSLFICSFVSQLIWVRLGWNFHRWFSIQKQVHVNWCTIDPFSLKFCTSQHSYPVPLTEGGKKSILQGSFIFRICNKMNTLHSQTGKNHEDIDHAVHTTSMFSVEISWADTYKK